MFSTAAIITSVATTTAWAQVPNVDDPYRWTGGQSSAFNDAGNWDPAVPGEDDVALLDLDAVYTIDFTGDAASDSLFARAGEVTLNLAAGGTDSTYTLGARPIDELNWLHSATVGVLPGDSAALNVKGGTLDPDHLILGYYGTSTGTVTLQDQAHLSLDNYGNALYVGANGQGTLNVEAGSTVRSHWASVGGRFIPGDHPTYAGYTGEGTVNVRGPGASWINNTFSGPLPKNSPLFIGQAEGTGTLNIEDGGYVSNGTSTIYIGRTSATGTVNIAGEGSELQNLDQIYIGYRTLTDPSRQSRGTLNITDGGAANTRTAFIGSNNLGVGEVNVQGQDSIWNINGLVTVGDEGHGTMNIGAGGTVWTRLGGSIGSGGGTGEVTVQGENALWELDNSVNIAGNFEAPNGSTGTLTVRDGGRVESTSWLRVWNGGSIDGDSTISVNNALLNQGLVTPGIYGDDAATGTLTLQGDYQQGADGNLTLRIAGNPTHDALSIDGSLSLDGTLELIATDGYQPTVGDTFAILDWTGDLEGEFANIDTFDLGEGYEWNLDDLYNQGTISIAVPEPGSLALLGLGGLTLLRRRRPARR